MIKACIFLLFLGASIAPADETRARALMAAGSFAESATVWQSMDESVLSLSGLASAQRWLGFNKLARANLEKALEMATGAEVVAIRNSLGEVLMLVDKEIAAEHLNAAHELAKAEAPDAISAILLNLGNLATLNKDRESAATHFEAALALSPGPMLAARLHANVIAISSTDRATALLAELRHLQLPASYGSVVLLVKLGKLAQEAGDADSAAAFANSAQSQAKGLPAGARSQAAGFAGHLAEEAGDVGTALRLTRQALFLAQQTGSPHLLYRWQWQLGRLRQAQGDLQAAVSAFELAMRSVSSIRHDLSVGLWRQGRSYRDTIGPLYYGLADLHLQVAKKSGDVAHLHEARRVIETLKSAELEDYFQDDCVNVSTAQEVSLDQVSGGAAIVYIIPLADRTEILVGDANGLRATPVAVGNAKLTKTVRAFRRNLETRSTNRYLREAQQLYKWLMAPIVADLEAAEIDTLVFVPDGALRTIPMGAMHDGKGFLISRFAVAVAPGLTLLDPQPVERSEISLFINALSQPVQGYPALPFVNNEIESISTMFPGMKLVDEEFRAEVVEREFGKAPYTIVHIASHGEFSAEVSDSFVLTWDGRLTLDNLERMVRPRRVHGKPVELLTLSACRTAAGDDRAALGLAGVSIKAGARSALATLWYVNDQASADLVSTFYQVLSSDNSISKAQALRQAQLAIAKKRKYRHPGFWAPFIMIGNWL
jgi:CHAT domain-containing protein